MQNTIKNYLVRLVHDRTKRRRAVSILVVLSLVVAIGVFWQLKMTGITMAGDVYCGIEEHHHDEQCIRRTLICGHTEVPDPYNAELPETDAVVKAADEIETEPAESFEFIDSEAEPEVKIICEIPEGHIHGEECYETVTVEGEYVCGIEAHTHDENCTSTREVLTCSIEEHTHTEECWSNPEPVLVCGSDEEGHEHTDECYVTPEAQLICDKDEHTHTADMCYVTENVECELAEHEHDASCAKTETVLICEVEENHVHTDACYAVPETEPETETETETETDETEPAHVHTEECYLIEYICGKEEHTHSVECYADVNADLETAEDWEKDLPELTGFWADDLVAVAQSQLGYTESERNYVLADAVNGSEGEQVKQGYNRYGAWYGNPYGDWSAMFAAFCLHYSGIPKEAVPYNSGVNTMLVEADNMELLAAEDYIPVRGDLVFFDRDANGSADLVGIVSAADEETVWVICGDVDGVAAEIEVVLAEDETITAVVSLDTAYNTYVEIYGEPEPIETEETEAEETEVEETEETETELTEEDEPIFASMPDEPVESADIHIEVTFGESEDGKIIVLEAKMNGMDASEYLWQWQTSESGLENWIDMEGETSLVCTLPATDENLAAYYRICGIKQTTTGSQGRVMIVTLSSDGLGDAVPDTGFDYDVISDETTETPDTSDVFVASYAITPKDSQDEVIDVMSIGGQESVYVQVGEKYTITSGTSTNPADSGHTEKWESDNTAIAKVEGITNSDNQYKQTSATITGVSAGTTTITHTYYTAYRGLISGNYYNWKTHTETITVTVTKNYTVTFNIGTDAAAAGVKVPDPVKVTDGQTVSVLPTPVWKKAEQYVKIFAGWYSDELLTTEFTTSTQVTADITLYAKWVDPLVEGKYVVTFNIGEAETAGVTAPNPVMVTPEQTVSELPTPVWKNADGQYEKIFAGWYSDELLTKEFTTSTPVTGHITLYAKWVAPDAAGMYYVNFYSKDGGTVHLTLAVQEGKTVSPANGPILSGHVFKFWSTTMQGDSSVDNSKAFDFSTPISSAVAEGRNTLNLYAWYAPAVKVTFISNGGSAVPTQFIAQGETATEVTPTRTGYTFEGWYTDEGLTTKFVFTTPVNNDITLYAKWSANMVPVTLVYMYENADDAEYSPAGYYETVYAPAGSYLSIEKSNITAIGQSHAVRYSETADGSLTGYASTAGTGGQNAVIDDVKDTYFQYENATNNRQVMPDGSTVVLLYYNRVRVTLEFDYTASQNGSMLTAYNKISDADKTKYATSYSSKTNGGFTYSFTAKYGESITAVWPQIAWVENKGNFYGWNPAGGTVQTSNMYTLESSLFMGKNVNNPYIQNSELTAYYKLTSETSKTEKDYLIYARSTLPGETADFIYEGKNYTIYTEACQLGYSPSGTFGYKDLDGCTPVSDKPTLSKEYGNNMSIKNLTVNGGSLKGKFDQVFPNEIETGDNCQVLLYDRKTIMLSVWANDDAHPAGSNPQTEDYLYGDWIYNDNEDLLKNVESSMAKKGYIFAGWYTNPNFTPGTEYTLDENTRIYGNLNLYAKWEPNQFRAEYYLYMDDTSPYATQGFAEGGKIDNKFVPAAVQESFIGWYWYDKNGNLVPFDFTSTVGAAHVDDKGVLKLYAMWTGTTGKVSYLPGIGGDNATQEVIDPRDFAINDAAVQLPVYTEVWTDGSVPTDKSLTFVGWKAPNGKIYQPGRYVTVTRQLMQFEAQWSSDAVTLIYDANGGSGDNVTETWARNSVVDIWDNMDANTPHFTRDGYELLGWDTNKDATVPTYRLGVGTITLDVDSTTLYAIWKPLNYDLTIVKFYNKNMNQNDKGYLAGAEFTLSGGGLETKLITAGEKGTVTVSGLRIGTVYTLTETKAPDGFYMLTEPIYFMVTSDAKVVFCDKNGDALDNDPDFANGTADFTTDSRTVTISVKNESGSELPQTGGAGTYLYTFSGIILMLIPFMYFGLKRRKRERRA